MSDLKQNRYVCKEHKRMRRENWKTSRLENLKEKLGPTLVCRKCKKEKSLEEFHESYLSNSDYVCKNPCAVKQVIESRRKNKK